MALTVSSGSSSGAQWVKQGLTYAEVLVHVFRASAIGYYVIHVVRLNACPRMIDSRMIQIIQGTERYFTNVSSQ